MLEIALKRVSKYVFQLGCMQRATAVALMNASANINARNRQHK